MGKKVPITGDTSYVHRTTYPFSEQHIGFDEYPSVSYSPADRYAIAFTPTSSKSKKRKSSPAADAKAKMVLDRILEKAKKGFFESTAIQVIEHLSKEGLSEVLIEKIKEFYQLRRDYFIYRQNLPKIKANLRYQNLIERIVGIPEERIVEAYHLLDATGSTYVQKFYRDNPSLADTIDENLPSAFRNNPKFALQKGFRRFETDEEESYKVKRDNLLAIHNDIKRAVNEEKEGKPSNLDIVLAIAVEAGLENDTITQQLQKLSTQRQQALRRKYPTLFGKQQLDTKAPERIKRKKKKKKKGGFWGWLKKGVSKVGNFVKEKVPVVGPILSGVANVIKNPPLIAPLVSGIASLAKTATTAIKGLGNSFGRAITNAGKAILGLLGYQVNLEELDLVNAQTSMQGNITGVEFSREANTTSKDYIKWLEEKGKMPTEEEKKKGDQPALEKLDAGELSVQLNLGRKEDGFDAFINQVPLIGYPNRGRFTDQNSLTAFASTLPFKSINYLAGDMTVRSEAGFFNHLFAEMTWESATFWDCKESKIVDVELLLKEVTFNNLRVVLQEETYGIGKLQIKDISLVAKQLMENAGKRLALYDNLMAIIQNLPLLAMYVAQTAIYTSIGKEATQKSGESLKALLATGPLDFTDLLLQTGAISIEHFYSTSMGAIDHIELESTKLDLKHRQQKENGLVAPHDSPEKKSLAENKEKLEKRLEQRANRHTESSELDQEIAALRGEIAQQEAALAERHKDLAYDFRFETEGIHLKGNRLVQEMLNSMLLESFKGAGLVAEGLEGIEDISFPQGLDMGSYDKKHPQTGAPMHISTEVSAEKVKNMGLRIPEVKFHQPVKLKKFRYELKENDSVTTSIVGENVVLHNLHIFFSDEPVKKNFFTPKIPNLPSHFTEGMGLETAFTYDEGDFLESIPIKMKHLKTSQLAFDQFALRMPKPNGGGMYDLMRFSQPMAINNFNIENLDYSKAGIKLQLYFDELLERKPDQESTLFYQYQAEEKGQDPSKTNIVGGVKLGDFKGMAFTMDGDDYYLSTQTVTIPYSTLKKLNIETSGLLIDSKNQCEIHKVALLGLQAHVNLKESIYRIKFDHFSIQQIHFDDTAGKIHYNNKKVAPLKNITLTGFLAEDLWLDLSKEGIYQQFKQGTISFKNFNVHDVTVASLAHINDFNINHFKLQRVKNEEKILIEGDTSIDGTINLDQDKKLSVAASTDFESAIGEKDGKSTFEGALKDIQVDAKLEDALTGALMKLGVAADSIQWQTNGVYVQLDMGNAISLNHLSFEDKQGNYIRRDHPEKDIQPLQLIKPRAHLTILWEELLEEKAANKAAIDAPVVKPSPVLKGLQLTSLTIEEIRGGNLQVKFDDNLIRIPYDAYTGIKDIQASGQLRFDGKEVKTAVQLSTGATAFREIQAILQDGTLLQSYLSMDRLQFNKSLEGVYELEIHNTEAGISVKQLNREILKNASAKEDGFDASLQVRNDHLRVKTDLTTFAEVTLGETLELPSIGYKDTQGNYLKQLQEVGGKSPVKLVRPTASIKFIREVREENGKNVEKVVGYELEQLLIEKIIARNLQAKLDILTLTIPADKEASIENIALSGQLFTETMAFSLSGNTGKINAEEIGVVAATAATKIKTEAYLSAEALSFSKEINGEATIEVEGIDLGILTQAGATGYDFTQVDHKEKGIGNLHLSTGNALGKAPMFRAANIKAIFSGDSTKLMIKEPVLGELIVVGDFTDEHMGIHLQRLVLSGALDGDLMIKDSPQQLIIESEEGKDVLLTIPEARVSTDVSSLENLLDKFPEKEKKKQVSIRDYAQKEFEQRTADFGFLNFFDPSHITVYAYKKPIVLNTYKLDDEFPQRTYINLYDFSQELGSVMGNYFIDEYFTFLKPLMDTETFVSTAVGKVLLSIEKDFKKIYKQSEQSLFHQKHTSLPVFAAFLEHLMSSEHLLPLLAKNIIDEIIPYLIEEVKPLIQKGTISATTLAGLKKGGLKGAVVGLVIGGAVAGGLEIGEEQIGKKSKKALKESLFDSSDSPGLMDELIKIIEETGVEFPTTGAVILSVVEEMIQDLNLSLRANIQADFKSHDPTSRGMLRDKTDSDLTKREAAIHSNIALNFHRDEKTGNTATHLLLKDTYFNGFSYPIYSEAATGKLSTKSMGFEQLSLRMSSFKKTSQIDLEAKNISLEGFKLVIDKQPPKKKKTS